MVVGGGWWLVVWVVGSGRGVGGPGVGGVVGLFRYAFSTIKKGTST